MMGRIRRYFISGLVVWIPIWVTILAIHFLIKLLGSSFSLVPAAYQPEALLGVQIPGLDVVFSLLIIFLTGMLVANFLGRKMMQLWEAIIDRIPLVRTIYNSVKQVLTTVFSTRGQAFRKVLLVEYPRHGAWSIAFQTGHGFEEANEKLNETDLITLFVPTTPNPTSGFLIVVPRTDIKELDMSVDEALKMVISLGVIQPEKAGNDTTENAEIQVKKTDSTLS